MLNYQRYSFFGLAALLTGIVSVLFSIASYGIVYLNITLELFNVLNSITALIFCALTPVTIILGSIGLFRKNDSQIASILAIILVLIPFFVVLTSLVNSFRR